MSKLIGVFVLAFVISMVGYAVARFREKQLVEGGYANPIPGWIPKMIYGVAVFTFVVQFFFGAFFYAQPGYMYHVRTITGQEKAINTTGYKMHLFGWYNAWKKALSVQAISGGLNSVDAENESEQLSASLPPKRVVFLDQVDAAISATVRFRLPTDEASFLAIAREYRSPENLLRTTLIPSFQETLDANGSLMTAEEYFSGGRTEFNRDFEDQIKDGIYTVRRIEDRVTAKQAIGTADASLDTEQEAYGDEEQIVLRVEKVFKDGKPLRKAQSYKDWGISVVEARITNVIPNDAFNQRMTQKQDASARRAVARETRIEEEEQRLLAITRGDREVAQKQAEWKVDQIERTTKQETDKAIALIQANKELEQARIQEQTAIVILQRDKTTAESVKVLADAEAYKREAIIESDNALQAKLDAELQIQKYWADAFSKRAVPSTVFVTGEASGTTTPTGSNTELQSMVQLMTMQMAKALDYDRSTKK